MLRLEHIFSPALFFAASMPVLDPSVLIFSFRKLCSLKSSVPFQLWPLFGFLKLKRLLYFRLYSHHLPLHLPHTRSATDLMHQRLEGKEKNCRKVIVIISRYYTITMGFFSNYQPNDRTSKESALWILFVGGLSVFIVPCSLWTSERTC